MKVNEARATDYDVIVIGAGPGGSTVAALLARKGHKVLVLERAKFPRFHIGESVTAFGTLLFKDLGVFEDLKKVNYIRKRGLAFMLKGRTRELFFPGGEEARDEDGLLPWAFQMPRGRFDDVLMKHSRKLGSDIREQQSVKRVLFENGRAVGVEWEDQSVPERPIRRATARFIVDASGQDGAINHQIGNNCKNHHLLQKKVAVFAHFETEFDFVNADREIGFRLCVHENGRDWAWWLPIDKNLISLGVVLSKDTVKSRKGDLEELFYDAAAGTNYLNEFIKKPMKRVGKFYSAVDYSYNSEKLVGPGWALVGDSAGFIDPVFSTGLQITFNSAFRLGETLERVLADPSVEERELAEYARIVDRYYRVNGTLVHLFYLAKIDPQLYEDPWYMWKTIPFASWKYRFWFLWWGLRLSLVKRATAVRWSEDVVFGNPGPDNLVARQFLMLSKNFDEVYRQEIAAREEHFAAQGA